MVFSGISFHCSIFCALFPLLTTSQIFRALHTESQPICLSMSLILPIFFLMSHHLVFVTPVLTSPGQKPKVQKELRSFSLALTTLPLLSPLFATTCLPMLMFLSVPHFSPS